MRMIIGPNQVRSIAKDELQLKIARLPVWAQRHIQALGRQRDGAQKALDNFLNASNDKSPFYTRDFGAGSVERKKYIKADSVFCEYNGIRMEIQPNKYREDGRIKVFINITHDGEIAIIPSASNLIEIVRIGGTH